MSFRFLPVIGLRTKAFGLFCCGLTAISVAAAEEKPDSTVSVKHQITGLFCVERVRDLEKTVEQLPNIKLESVDFKTAEATLRYDPVALFPKQPPEKVIEELNNRLQQVSRNTFGVKPLCQIPREKLTLIEVPVVGLDCKACSLVAYEAVYRIEGVEQATASFKEGLVTAWVSSDKVTREKLEEELAKRNVALKSRVEAKPQ